MTVKIRCYHLLCSLTYRGEGYSNAFVHNYDRIPSRLKTGEDIEIVAGPDDICQVLLQEEDEPHCHLSWVRQRDATAVRALEVALGISLTEGSRAPLKRDVMETLRSLFGAGSIRAACIDCEWHSLCTEIADGGFHGTTLWPPGLLRGGGQ